MKPLFLFLVTAVPLSTDCSQPAGTDSISDGGGAIEAINHTHWAINRFSVNGRSGVDIIDPWQSSGGVGYSGVPPEWEPGMTVKVEWETGVGDSKGLPGFADTKKYSAWGKRWSLKIENIAKLYLFLTITVKKPVTSKYTSFHATR